jgi:hypothetical protein
MPEQETLRRAKKDKGTQGKAPSTQAGQLMREELDHIREGMPRGALDQAGHRDRSVQGATRRRQTSATRPGQASEKTRQSAKSAYRDGQRSRLTETGKAAITTRPAPIDRERLRRSSGKGIWPRPRAPCPGKRRNRRTKRQRPNAVKSPSRPSAREWPIKATPNAAGSPKRPHARGRAGEFDQRGDRGGA